MSSTADEHRKHNQKGQGTVVQKLSTVSPGEKKKRKTEKTKKWKIEHSKMWYVRPAPEWWEIVFVFWIMLTGT